MKRCSKRLLILLLIALLGFILFGVIAAAKGDGHCECIDYDCGCCTKLQVKNMLDGNLCSNFSYLPEQYGLSATVTYKDTAILNETMSAKNPLPLCVETFDELGMEFCLRFYNLDLKDKCFSGCVEFEVSFFKVIAVKKIKLVCFGCQSYQTFITEIHSALNGALDHVRGISNNDTDKPKVLLL
ncbi:hypothetical protein TSAR_014732 [Trichomalopsis sarcophagae]|uniref:DUF4773 domain-containing protein n=1 Tax=Trichomalopsis sarcophagae TaxID=543379 RepID=A0A232EX84_9HYME|nr:hypothetical protein TSAR_014732 [Trichomalopsis sarcophagae]